MVHFQSKEGWHFLNLVYFVLQLVNFINLFKTASLLVVEQLYHSINLLPVQVVMKFKLLLLLPVIVIIKVIAAMIFAIKAIVIKVIIIVIIIIKAVMKIIL